MNCSVHVVWVKKKTCSPFFNGKKMKKIKRVMHKAADKRSAVVN